MGNKATDIASVRVPGSVSLRGGRGDTRPSDLPVDIAGMASKLDDETLRQAVRRAKRLGVGADEVLLATGTASPDELANAAARELGISFVALDDSPCGNSEAGVVNPPHSDLTGLLRSGIARAPGGRLVLAARGKALRALSDQLAAMPQLAPAVSLTTPERLAAHVRRHFGTQLADHAAYHLRDSLPGLSAHALCASRYALFGIALVLISLPFGLHQLDSPGMVVVAALLAVLLLGWSVLRLTACTHPPQKDRPLIRNDARLPSYTLMVPLYREARIVPQLVDALDALDYPREKLQIMLVVEPDDGETAAALVRHARRPGFEIFVAPDLGPRTKPKALNAAFAFARGEIVGVFDAEDIPDPQQLRRACTAFQREGADIACVQARLVIDNFADSWITRQFAAEYASHFDVVLPILARHRLPIPLGGTSNHFRREALERVGGWDPYNVTEDADLGIRLARAEWRTAVIDSATDEEAPRRVGAWLRQRSRWYKGWMQTLLVHWRRPVKLVREVGWVGSFALTLMLGGGLASALMHPFFLATLLMGWGTASDSATSLSGRLLLGIGVAVFAVGYTAALLSTVLGMRRRRIPGLWKVLPLIPVYWVLLSCAAWRALIQLILDPQRWEKTEHGLAQTSRRKRVRGGRLVVRRTTSSGANRRPPLPARA